MKFFHSIWSKLTSIFGSHTTVSVWNAIDTTVTYAEPFIEAMEAELAPEAVPETSKIIAEVKSDFSKVTDLATALHAGTAGPTATQDIVGVLEAIKSNLGALLTAGHIKNATTLSKVTTLANLVIGEVEAVLSHLKG